MGALPIWEVAEALVQSLHKHPRLVLIAPPGAGKTTVVPGLLVDQRVVEGAVWVLEPRRLAARLAASHVAKQRASALGGEVGYRVRFEDRTHRSTRIVYLTEGLLNRHLIRDPLLEGVGAVVLDEFHERSMHADLALAFLREVQETRPELRLIVMSATLDPGPVASFLDPCPVVRSEGRAHPVSIHHLERPDEREAGPRVVAGVKRALRGEGRGTVLGFLPGMRDIVYAERELTNAFQDTLEVLPLHGELERSAQDRAVAPREDRARRRVVLATNIAESSVTLPDVDTVVDGGLVNSARYDPAKGLDELETRRISRFSAEQRAGRAGRIGPGHAYRMWTAAEHRTLPNAEVPELARVDLTPALLHVLAWCPSDPSQFRWFESPPEGAMSSALRLLRRLGALPGRGFRLTPLGEALLQLPIHPRLGRMLLSARAFGEGDAGVRLAALASEREIARRDFGAATQVSDSDLLERLHRLRSFETTGASTGLGLDPGAARTVLRASRRLAHLLEAAPAIDLPADASGDEALLRATLAGFPDRVALRRGDELQLAEGGRARLDRSSVVRDSELLVAVRLEGRGSAREGRVRWASHVERAWLEIDAGGVEEAVETHFDADRERVVSERVLRFGRLVLSRGGVATGAPADPTPTLIEAARKDLERALPINDRTQSLLDRYNFVRRAFPEMKLRPLDGDARLEILPAMAVGRCAFSELRALDLASMLLSMTPLERPGLERLAPETIAVPSGRRVRLRYLSEGPPVLSVRLQEVFGLYETPRVADGRVPVKMELLGPNHRPVQITQDIASFWKHTYRDVRKELRRRYPKHQWPEDPAHGIPSARRRPDRSKRS